MELKEKLVECFKDTLQIINTNEKLLATTKAAVKNTNLFTPLVDNMLRNENLKKAVVTVIEDTSFHAAQRLVKQGYKVAVLNFASAVNPGGGVIAGAMAQEECLCRSSNLLPCLKQKKLMQDYYMPNRIANNPIYSDNLIYSEGITVFKTDDTVPVLMPENEWFKVDVITCAAPNLRNEQNFNEDKLYEIFISRIHAILDRAYLQGVDSVVLGAFGCGAFKNPPEIVSKAFKSEIESEFGKVFKNIIFAIKKSSNNNFDVFYETFNENKNKENENTENQYICPNCNTQLKKNDKFCLKCGTKTNFGLLLPCNNDEHCFVKHKELTGVTEYKCSKCGQIIVVHALPKPDCYNEIRNYIGSKLDGETITENWFEKPAKVSTDISSDLETMTSESKTKESKKLVCSKCGNVLNPNDRFCMKCGTKTVFEKDCDAEKDSPDNNEDVPEIIDNRYELIRQTGKGASSVVYLAQDKKLDRICAVKIVNKNTYANKIAAQESLNEANKMKLLAHISIPQLYDIFDDEDRLCIVMEFIEGKTLNEIIKSMTRPLDEYTIIQWSKQLCRVLFYLHTLKPPRIFRDLKPANIILQPNGVIKLIDFGTMKNYDDSRSEDTVNLGTKGYAAPEQFGGRGATDARTDIYGLGMTMYHLITGVNPSLPPFEFKPIRYYRKDVSKGLEDIVMKCIAIEREERYQSAIHILKDLERLG